MSRIICALSLVFALICPYGVFAQGSNSAPANQAAGISPTEAVGTVLTAQNWQKYRDYMPDGMAALFEGKYFWKMPSDVEMEIGPTVVNPLPKPYLEATEKFAGQVKLVELDNGGLTLSNYQGGIPFPNPAEPHRGWKVLADLWFRYLPHLTVNTNGVVCTMDSSNSVSCKAGEKVYRQLAYNTDPGVPSEIPGTEGKYFTQHEMVKEPEQERYTTVLTTSYKDLTRQEEVYVFIPSLRRYQPMSPNARCSADLGTDETPDDRRYGFNTNLTRINAEFVGEKKILALVDYTMPPARFPANYYMPLGWPMRNWGKWQLRDVYVVSVTKPGEGAGQCLGKKVVYIDKASFAPLWEDLYNQKLEPWRFVGIFPRTMNIPNLGPELTSNSMVYGFWDVKYSHATVFAEPGEGAPYYINEQAPKEYLDLERYTTPGGLSMIMR
ncbi:MAG TPA: DUF1329 domain-containing protein [Candidatus Binataceae bacterium]|nr:DUF1329 domain-containing protein [Candidatus Binataceae bacterium]